MEARCLNLMDYHYSWLRWPESRELPHMGWFFISDISYTVTMNTSSWFKHMSCNEFVWTRVFLLDQFHQIRQSSLLVTSDSSFTVGQSWLWQLMSYAFMTFLFWETHLIPLEYGSSLPGFHRASSPYSYPLLTLPLSCFLSCPLWYTLLL